MLEDLKIKNKHRKTLFSASWTIGVDHADNGEDNDSDLSKEESNDENLEIELNNFDNLSNNLSENLE